MLTLLWSAKEAVYKWFGDGEVEFIEHIRLKKLHEGNETINCFFAKTNQELNIHYRKFDHLLLTWVYS
jgi:4'-phosphopantetheinyl transferase EntD